MSEPPTRALDVAAMLASHPHLHGRMPCCPAEHSVAPKGETEPMCSLSALLRALSLSVRAGHGSAPLVAIASR
jgi:hypothetical protein